MKPYELSLLMPDGEVETVKAVAIIAFEERDAKNVALRMFDNPEIPEAWWRMVIKQMYDGLDQAMEDRRKRFQAAEAKESPTRP